MPAYYNENDKYCAQWLRNLIAADLIAPGDVDDRDIRDVKVDDLKGYSQCHFFAGIGIWSAALRQAGWPDDRPVWTGSCPCQPLSAAGKRLGTADERHLWPIWFELIDWHRPIVILGEQVASKDGLAWFDIVSSDLEKPRYRSGAIDLCAAGFGSPNIRQRLFWMAYATGEPGRLSEHTRRPPNLEALRDGEAGELADTMPAGRSEGWPITGNGQATGSGGPRKLGNSAINGSGTFDRQSCASERPQESLGGSSLSGELGDASSTRLARRPGESGNDGQECATAQRASGPVNGFWSDAEWIECTDGKARPIKPGTFPLAHGYPNRVAILRAAGNAINQEVAAQFIAAADEAMRELAER